LGFGLCLNRRVATSENVLLVLYCVTCSSQNINSTAEQRCESKELSDNSSVVSTEDERINKEQEEEGEQEQEKEQEQEREQEQKPEEEQEQEEEEQEQEREQEQEKEQEKEQEDEQEEQQEQEQEEQQQQMKPSETLVSEPLSSGINLFSLSNTNRDSTR